MKCLKCHTENPAGANFCNKCGHSFSDKAEVIKPRPALDAERKRVTALFSDISGYTAMASKLDPEEVKEITSRVFDGVREVVGKYEGFIERFAGDGVLALFGVPKAHEDDAIRAVHAAREIHELVESLSPRYESKIGRPLCMHSGVNTGLAVTADVNPEKGTHGVTGDAINVAARLSDLAQAREILVGPDTHRACQSHFSFQPLAPAKVKGKSEPIPIFRVLATQRTVPEARTGRQVSSEMVGRDSELDKLELQVMKAINGEGSVVNVIGEAGIGKSRLIAELKKRDVMKRVTLLEGRAISIGKNLSFHPIIDLLKQWARIAEDDGETVARDKMETSIQRACGDETDEVFPFVATMMGMKLTGRYAERVKGIEGEGLEKLILKNVRELVIRGSELRPSVIIMEDLHWADTSSMELLGSLYRLAEKHKLVFINVFRPGYFESDDGALAKVGETLPDYYVEIEIQPLDKTDSEALINNMLAIKGLPHSLKEQIVERAGGNPFFIEEVVRSLIDEGAVVRRDGAFEVTDRIGSVVIPPTINDVLIARIDRLEDRTRELVKVASVIGRSFFDRILKDVADSIGDVDDRLAYLKDVQMIRDRTRMQELEYLFKHALAQEAAYESTLIQQRKALHLKVAQSIEKLFQDRLQEFYGMLAFHYSKGEDLKKAEEYLIKAGEEALRSSASAEALDYFQAALKLYVENSGDAADVEKIAWMGKNIALAYFNRGQNANAVKFFDRVLARLAAEEKGHRGISSIGFLCDFTMLTANLYSPLRKGKRIPDEREIELLELWFRKAKALTPIDAKRCFAAGIVCLKMLTQFDEKGVPFAASHWATSGAFLSFGGLSFKLSRKFLERAESLMNWQSVKESIVFTCDVTVADVSEGSWSAIKYIDEDLLHRSLRHGEFWDTATYLLYWGKFKVESGDFKAAEEAIRILTDIEAAFDYETAGHYAYALKTKTLTKMRKPSEALAKASAGLSFADRTGLDRWKFRSLGYRIINQVLLHDILGAKHTMVEAADLVRSQKSVPCSLAPYLTGCFLSDIYVLEEAIHSGNSASSLEFRAEASRRGRAALKNSRKYASFRTEILKLMGDYYWLIGRQSKAMKWWARAIKEGERLGARPDLSRTYFEVGKRMLEPQSKYKQLNGIDANGYLEKAGILFEEMGLERDLEDLERVWMGM